MLIRAAIPEDIPQMIALAGDSAFAAHWTAREYDALFAPEAPARVAVVACDQADEIAGFLIARCGAGEWEIENLVIAPELRQQGIGGRLIQEVLRQARERGAADVFLEVRESNVAARRLYEKAGFREAGRRTRYYRDPEEDGLVLRLGL